MIEQLDYGQRDSPLERGHVHDRAACIRLADERHLLLVVVPVAAGVGALAEGLAVLFVAHRRVVQPVRRGEFEFLTESQHGLLGGS